jgi:hypothetical protein
MVPGVGSAVCHRIFPANGVMYVGSNSGQMYALDETTDYARQHFFKKLDVSRTSENPGNHSIGPIFFCSVDVLTTNVCGKRTAQLDAKHTRWEGQHDLDLARRLSRCPIALS